MKRRSPLLAAAALLLASVGLLRWTGQSATTQSVQAAGAWILEQQLGSLATATRIERDDVESEQTSVVESAEESATSSAEPVPVETVSEAWDEEARQTEGEDPPAEVKVDADVSLELRNSTNYEIDFTQLPALPENLDFQSQEPVILIMHTHTTECYADGGEGTYRSQDENDGVMAVGDAMAEELEARGYAVIHDKTLCDYPEYNGAYSRSRTVISDNLEQYPSICLVLDIHRDAVADETGAQMRMASTIAGTEAAQLMLVVGTDEGGLEHPNWQENLSLAAVLQARMSTAYPGIMRPINLRSERFNQDLGPLNLLVEVGASGNTLEEALQSGRYLAEILADVMDQYSGKSS